MPRICVGPRGCGQRSLVAFQRGQIIWLEFDPAAGHEQRGRRPAVVVSPQSYNEVSSLCIVCPITSNPKPWAWKVAFKSRGNLSGWVLADQLRSVDTSARHMMDSGDVMDADDLHNLMAKVRSLVI